MGLTLLFCSPLYARGNRGYYSLKQQQEKANKELQKLQPFGEKCELNPPEGKECPAFFANIIGTSDFRGLFTRFAGQFKEDSPWGLCSGQTTDTRHIKTAAELEQSYLSHPELSLEGRSVIDQQSSCFNNKSETYKKALVAEYYTSGNRLKDNFEHSLRSLSEIDSTLGRTSLKGIDCDFPLNQQKEYCEKLKSQCQAPRSTLDKINELEKKLQQMSRKRFNSSPASQAAKREHNQRKQQLRDKIKLLKNSPPQRTEKMQSQIEKTMRVLDQVHSLNLEIKSIRSKTSQCSKRPNCRNKVNEVRDKIKAIEAQAPWVKGDQFEDYLGDYKKAYQNFLQINSENPESDKSRQALAQSQGLIEKAISAQLLESRKQLQQRLPKTGKAMRCLLDQQDPGVRGRNACNEKSYAKVLKSSPSFTPLAVEPKNPDQLKALPESELIDYQSTMATNDYSTRAQCIREKVNQRKANDQLVLEVGVGAALTLLPFGQLALLRLGTMGSKALLRSSQQVASSMQKRRLILGADVGNTGVGIGSSVNSCEKEYAKSLFQAESKEGQFSCPGEYTDDQLQSNEQTLACLSSAIMAGVPFVGYGMTAKAFAKLNRVGGLEAKNEQMLQAKSNVEKLVQENRPTPPKPGADPEPVTPTELESFHNNTASAPVDEKVQVAQRALDLDETRSAEVRSIVEDPELQNQNPLLEKAQKRQALKEKGYTEEEILTLEQSGVLTRPTPLDEVAPPVVLDSPDDLLVSGNILRRGEEVFIQGRTSGQVVGYGKDSDSLLIQVGSGADQKVIEVPFEKLTKNQNTGQKGYRPQLAGDPYPLESGQFILNGRIWNPNELVAIPNPSGQGVIYGRVQKPQEQLVRSDSYYAGQYIPSSAEIKVELPRSGGGRTAPQSVPTDQVQTAVRTFDEVTYTPPGSSQAVIADVIESRPHEMRALILRCTKKNECQESWVDMNQLQRTSPSGRAFPSPARGVDQRMDDLVQTGNYGNTRELVIRRMANMNEAQRRETTRKLFPNLSDDQVDAVVEAHEWGEGTVGRYPVSEVLGKRRIMTRANIPKPDQDLLLDLGIAGKPNPPGMTLHSDEFLVSNRIIQADTAVEITTNDGITYVGNIKNGNFNGDIWVKPKGSKQVIKVNVADVTITPRNRSGILGREAVSDTSAEGLQAHNQIMRGFRNQLTETLRQANELRRQTGQLADLQQQVSNNSSTFRGSQGWDQFATLQSRIAQKQSQVNNLQDQFTKQWERLYEKYLQEGGTLNPIDFQNYLIRQAEDKFG